MSLTCFFSVALHLGTSSKHWKILHTMEFHAFGAVKERENARKLKRENGMTKCSDDLVLSGRFLLNSLEINDGRLLFRNASKMTMFCWVTKSGIFKMLCFTNSSAV